MLKGMVRPSSVRVPQIAYSSSFFFSYMAYGRRTYVVLVVLYSRANASDFLHTFKSERRSKRREKTKEESERWKDESLKYVLAASMAMFITNRSNDI